MPTVAGTAAVYTKFKLNLDTGNLRFSTGNHTVLLVTSSYTVALDTHEFVSDITNEVSGNGYARQPVSVTWTATGSTVNMKPTDPAFTASGGNLTARRWVLFRDSGSDATSRLIATGLLKSTNEDVTVGSGDAIVVDFSATNGVFSI